MNYWLLLASPDKWFCDRCVENAKVNDTLKTLKQQSWRVRKDYFANAKIKDRCVIKVSKDNRSIERRTLKDDEVVDILESGIYAIGEIIQELYYDKDDDSFKIDVKILENLFEKDRIIDAQMSEKILGNDFFVQGSKRLDKNKYEKIISIIDIENSSFIDELEGDSTIEPNSDDSSDIYPVEVNIQRDMFSVRELKTDFEEEMLILAPDFQREFVWKLKQKSELIESILMGIPLPMIYFFEGENGVIQVVDGKQRLTTLFEFLDNQYPLSHTLSILKDLRGKKYKDLSPAQKAKIARYQFVVQTIIPPTPDKIKFDIFERVNRKGTTLNNQEMRNALYYGESTDLLKKLSNYQSFKKATDESISPTRMKDRYIILRFLSFYLWREKKLIVKNKTVEYRSDIDEFLGNAMTFLNHTTDEVREELSTIFDKSMRLSFELRGENGFRIPSKDRKRPINMALMESLSYLYSQIYNSNVNKKQLNTTIDNIFKDEDFLNSITQKVDSSISVQHRFDTMDKILMELKDD